MNPQFQHVLAPWKCGFMPYVGGWQPGGAGRRLLGQQGLAAGPQALVINVPAERVMTKSVWCGC